MKEINFCMTSKPWNNHKPPPRDKDRGVKRGEREEVLKKKVLLETLSVLGNQLI